MMVNNFLLVGAGGAIGSMLRYATFLVTNSKNFPLATFIVNMTGSFFIGILFALSVRYNISDYGWKFLAIGMCGGFTTFSAFSLEGLQLLQQQRYFIFLLYFVASIAGGLAATYAGYFLTQYSSQ
ncbi:MAG: fluoride efflux transporter CrcB [Chitinophagaceae bacterium]|jgi:CrcB protein|nr:fluoride efflux transporter CrcB [Chitinophagaceae bacterium]